MAESITFIGLDVHKATIAVAIADGGSREAARSYGTIDNTPAALAKLVRRLAVTGRSCSFATRLGLAGMASTGTC